MVLVCEAGHVMSSRSHTNRKMLCPASPNLSPKCVKLRAAIKILVLLRLPVEISCELEQFPSATLGNREVRKRKKRKTPVFM